MSRPRWPGWRWGALTLALLGGVDAQSTRGRVYEDAYVVQSIMTLFNAPPVGWNSWKLCAEVKALNGNEGVEFAQFLVPRPRDQVSARLLALFSKLRHGSWRTSVPASASEEGRLVYTVQYGPTAKESVLMYLLSPVKDQRSTVICVRRARYYMRNIGFNR